MASAFLRDAFEESLAKLKASVASQPRSAAKTATKAASAAPRIAADSPAGKALARALGELRTMVDDSGQSKNPRAQQGATSKGTANPAPRRTPNAATLSEMRAGAAEHAAKVTPAMVGRLEEEQRRRRAAKGLPSFARGGVVKSRAPAKGTKTKARATTGLLPLPRATATAKATDRSSTRSRGSSRGGSRRGR